jgi:hypothetical protein
MFIIEIADIRLREVLQKFYCVIRVYNRENAKRK